MRPTSPLQRLVAGVVAALVGLSLLAGCSSDPEEASPAEPAAPAESTTTESTTTTLPPLDPDLAYVATPTEEGDQPVYEEPSEDAAVSKTFPNPWLGTSPLVFLVKERVDADWYQVYLPTRPNGSTGFVPAEDIDVTSHAYRVEVHLSDFRLVVHEGESVLLDTTVAVAAQNTPTPGGLYYITELRGRFEPTNAYGTYAYGLSGFSEVHQTFEGGPGQLGIHGTNKPELIGQAVSNGCIRMRNEDIEKLVPLLPLGVPVEVIA